MPPRGKLPDSVIADFVQCVALGAPDPADEIARHPGIEDETWNHPALAGDILPARNSEEAAAFRLELRAE